MPRRQHELFRLNVENVSAYLGSVRFRLPFLLPQLQRVEEVGEYSNTNWLFRLTIGGLRPKHYYLKQSQRYNRRSVVEGRPISLPFGRTAGEVKLIRKLTKLWGSQAVPRVHFYDARHHICLLSDAARGGTLLIEEFSHDRVHSEIALTLGRYLGKLHATTYKTRERSGSSREWCDLMINFFDTHWGYGVRQHFPPRVVADFYREVCGVPSSIVWGDPIHRNIFVQPHGKVSMVDFDFTIRYDPMLDIGMLLAHWVWMWLKGRPRLARDCERFISTCTRAYWACWRTQPRLVAHERRAMEQRLERWIGLYLLSRVDGKTGSYFEEWPVWEKRIRQLGADLFAQRSTRQARAVRQLLQV